MSRLDEGDAAAGTTVPVATATELQLILLRSELMAIVPSEDGKAPGLLPPELLF